MPIARLLSGLMKRYSFVRALRCLLRFFLFISSSWKITRTFYKIITAHGGPCLGVLKNHFDRRRAPPPPLFRVSFQTSLFPSKFTAFWSVIITPVLTLIRRVNLLILFQYQLVTRDWPAELCRIRLGIY